MLNGFPRRFACSALNKKQRRPINFFKSFAFLPCFYGTTIKIQCDLNDDYETNVWRKCMNTGLLLSFNAMCPKLWKSGLIMCFLH